MWLHVLPGRARARIPGLRHNSALAGLVERHLAGCPGVRSVAASTATGTVLVHYDPTVSGLERLTAWLHGAAATEAAATAEPAPAPPVARPQPLTQGFLFPGPEGLSPDEVRRRRTRYGPNAVPEPARPPFVRRLLDQYREPMQLILALGAGLSLLSGHRRDGMTIGALLLLNGLVGASQAGVAPHAVAALRAMGQHPARVLRGGAEVTVPAEELVPGDLLLLKAGERLPADAEVVHSAGLSVDEALLTGECAAVAKGRGDRLAAGTIVTQGWGRAVVAATGSDSALGRIAALLGQPEPPTPLQRQMEGLARRVARAGIWVAAGAAAVGILRGQGAVGSLLSGVSLAISAVPEGLPTFVTLALAAGAQRLAGRGGRFQSLGAVDSMGRVTTLCLDKTGTLTQGLMTLTEVRLPDAAWRVTGSGYAPEGRFIPAGVRGGSAPRPQDELALRRLLKVAALCTSARLGLDEHGALVARGDSTELAMLVAALKAGIRACGGEGDRVLEVPFTAQSRRMTVVCRDGQGHAVSCAKGAPEALLPVCSRILIGGEARRLDRRMRTRLERESAEMAGRGLRVLAVAFRPIPGRSRLGDAAEHGLTLLGLMGLADLPRPDALPAIRRCRQAGVRPIILTGDHPATAAAVARQVGILVPGGAILTGDQIADMSDGELQRRLQEVTVAARVTPEHKLRIVRALRAGGEVVAMVGDGVNDSPAMRAADVGVAMGERGNEVARAAAGLVLEDDSLETVAAAIEQGRATGGNIGRMTRYLLGSNAAEVCLLGAALLLGLPLPLLPVQLLWMNLVGDLMPAAALGAEPPEPGTMRTPGRGNGLDAGEIGRHALGHGLRLGLAAAGVYALALMGGRPLPQARSLAMVTLAAGQIRHLRRCRSATPGPPVARAGAFAAALTLGALCVPPLRRVLQFGPLGPGDLALAAGAAWVAAPGQGWPSPAPEGASGPAASFIRSNCASATRSCSPSPASAMTLFN